VRSATVLENLNMAEPLLSRFDLVFILLDASDEQRDRHLSEHVMALHSGEGSSVNGVWVTELS
jgi:DNA helicase MCM8